MPTDPEAQERRICGAGAVMPVDLVALMLAHVEDDSDPGGSVQYMLRCPLEGHGSGPHHALTWVLDDPREGEVWAQWDDGRDPHGFLVLPDCNVIGRAQRGGGEEACGLFAVHPGGHSFEFADPVREAFERSPQYRRVMAAVEERTRRPEPDPPDHATGRQGPPQGWAPPA
ncbi:hypothetical protein ACIQNG_25755 [Streptomyces sp. NPDC091377]|uniref:hypothetical protein n=1 Tax=Streptomyces sp. NPDC091377 TaxID=3365995 RepID=UPI00382C817B